MGTFLFAQVTPFPSETITFFGVIQKGGPLMWLIVVGGVIGLGVFLERLFHFRSNQIGVGEFLLGINNSLRKKNFKEALERCDQEKGPVVQIVRHAIVARTVHNIPSAELREIVKEIAQLQLPRLEDRMSILATIGHVMPLIGLLGTVTGMIDAFIEIHQAAGAASVSDIASGIWTALITTAAGLSIAIPCDVGYNFLVSRMNHLISDMERAGIEVIHVLTEVNFAVVTTPPSSGPAESLTLLPPEKSIPNPVIVAHAQKT